MTTSPTLGQPRVIEDWIVTLTPIPDLSEALGRGVRRRAHAELSQLRSDTTRSLDDAAPTRLETPALTSPGSIRATLSREPGPAGHGATGDYHWHLAMSLSRDGQRGPAPIEELAAWIAAGWPSLNAIDTFLITGILTARHALLPL